MTYKVSEPFETQPPRLKDLVNQHIMGDVWIIRDTPFGSITDSRVLAKKFGLSHGKILRSIDKCKIELAGVTSREFLYPDKNLTAGDVAGCGLIKSKINRPPDGKSLSLLLFLMMFPLVLATFCRTKLDLHWYSRNSS